VEKDCGERKGGFEMRTDIISSIEDYVENGRYTLGL
jgi:hypothetical protein